MVQLPKRNLDVLRATAVLLVLGAHVLITYSHQPSADALAIVLGQTGVLLFFVHTSLVLMASLEREHMSHGWVGQFYIRRAWRIYPLAIAVIALVLWCGIPKFGAHMGEIRQATSHSLAAILSNVLLVHDLAGHEPILGVYWTLSIEVQMYLLLPAYFLAARRGMRAATMLLFASIVIGVVGLWITPHVPGLWRLRLIAYVPCFAAGVYAYARCRQNTLTGTQPSFPAWTLAGLLAILPVVYWGCQQLGWPGFPLCLALGIALPLIVDSPSSWLTRGANTIATYSYGIYLLHIPALWFGVQVCRHLPILGQICVSAATLLTLSWAAYHAIEHPGIRMGRWLAARYAARYHPATDQAAPIMG